LTAGRRAPVSTVTHAGVLLHRFDHYLVFILLTLGGGLLIGLINLPDEWYQSLAKPWFTPPDWLFGPAWTILYILIGIAGARTYARSRRSPVMTCWIAQLVLNFAWSPAFFGLKSPSLGLMIIIPLLLLILAFIGLSWKRDRISSVLFMPYAVWVAYATALNAAIASMN
jgi:benzodiazapine receptor